MHLLTALTLQGHDTSPCAGLKTPKTMESRNIKLQKATSLLLLLLLCSSAVAKQPIPDCCRQKSCSCRIFETLRGMGNHAAGILTLGKRGSATATKSFQSRLYHLLHSSDNQAAGILTMGKRVNGLALSEEEVPSAQLTPGPYAMRPDPAKVCQASLDEELPTIQKTGAANTIY